MIFSLIEDKQKKKKQKKKNREREKEKKKKVIFIIPSAQPPRIEANYIAP